jgi:transposase InsO family protein
MGGFLAVLSARDPLSSGLLSRYSQWRKSLWVRGSEMRAYIDTGAMGWSLLNTDKARELGLPFQQLQAPVLVSSPLGAEKTASYSAMLELTREGSVSATDGDVIEVLLVDFEKVTDIDLFVSAADAAALGFEVSIVDRRAQRPEVFATVEGAALASHVQDRKDVSTVTALRSGATRSLDGDELGIKFGVYYNDDNTVDFSKHAWSIVEALKRNAKSEEKFQSALEPIKLRWKAGVKRDDLPWSRMWMAKSETHREIMDEYIRKMLRRGCFEEVVAANAARPPGLSARVQMFVVAWNRVVGNFLIVNPLVDNASTMADLPDLLERIIERAARASIISKIDLRSAYDALPITGIDLYVGMNNRTFRLKSLPQGLAISPFLFNGILQALLTRLREEVKARGEDKIGEAYSAVEAYFDDIFCGSEVTVASDGRFEIGAHVRWVLLVIEMLNSPEVSLVINTEKSVFLSNAVDVGGWHAGHGRISLPESRRDQLRSLSVPTTGAALRESLGLLVYLQGLVKSAAIWLAPCHRFSNVKGPLPPEAIEVVTSAFAKVTEELLQAPGLHTTDYKLPFVLTTDASRIGVGFVLANEAPDGELRVVKHGSRALSKAEKSYSASNLELLALFFGLRQCEYFLLGRRFRVRTDHKALIGALGAESPRDLTLRWWTYIQGFTFDIEYIRGIDNGTADALSRLQWDDPTTKEWIEEVDRDFVAVPHNVAIRGLHRVLRDSVNGGVSDDAAGASLREEGGVRATAVLAVLRADRSEDREGSRTGPPVVARGLLEDEEEACYVDGPIVYAADGSLVPPRDNWRQNGQWHWNPGRPWVRPPEEERAKLIKDAHERGHAGTAGTVNLLQDVGWRWPGIWADVKTQVQECRVCQAYRVAKKGTHLTEPDVYDEVYPGRHICVDKMAMPPSRDGFQYILVLVDVGSRKVWARALRTGTAVEVAREMLDIFFNDGFPMVISSDNGTEFVNQVVDQMKALMGVRWRTITPWHPQGNGVAERAVKRILDRIRRLVDMAHDEWAYYLQTAVYTVNTTRSETTLSIPFELYFARPVRSLTDYRELGVPAEADLAQVEQARMRDAARLIDVVIPGLSMRQRMLAKKRTERSGARAPVRVFEKGQLVWVENIGKSSKLDRLRSGPWIVQERLRGGAYRLADGAGGPELKVSTNRLVPFKGPGEVEGTVFHIEKILDHRVDANGEREFLVKWVDYIKPTWNKESDFLESHVINDYLRSASGSSDVPSKSTKKGQRKATSRS